MKRNWKLAWVDVSSIKTWLSRYAQTGPRNIYFLLFILLFSLVILFYTFLKLLQNLILMEVNRNFISTFQNFETMIFFNAKFSLIIKTFECKMNEYIKKFNFLMFLNDHMIKIKLFFSGQWSVTWYRISTNSNSNM